MKYLRCLAYICRHKYFVWYFGRLLGVTLWQLLIHDLSKLRPLQLIGYAEYKENQQSDNATFQRAVHDHFVRSPHHWNHWVVISGVDNGAPYGLVLPMPDTYVREMVADWAATGYMKKGYFDLIEYYDNVKASLLLHGDTRDSVERYIEILHGRNISGKISA